MEVTTQKAVVIAALLVAYLICWMIVRWFASARFNQQRLQSQITILRARLTTQTTKTTQTPQTTKTTQTAQTTETTQTAQTKTSIRDLLDRAEAIILGDKVRSANDDLIDEILHPVKSFISQTFYFFTWTGRRELQAWLCVYEAERQSVDSMEPEEVMRRLSTAQAELEKLDQPGAGALKEAIESYLKKSEKKKCCLPAEVKVVLPANLTKLPEELTLKGTIKSLDDSPDPATEEKEAKQLLKESLRLKHRAYGEDLARLLSLHNKLTWVMLLGLAAIGALALIGDPAPLFFGGLGGLFSTMQRTRAAGDQALSNSNVVRWIRIYVSPLIGAIAAFVGLLLISLLASLNLLGQPFQPFPPIIKPPAATTTATVTATTTPTARPTPTVTTTVVPTATPLACPTLEVTGACTELFQLYICCAPSPFKILSGTMELAAGKQRIQISIEPSETASEATSETAVLAYSAMLALAFILGFSERLFMTYVGRLDPKEDDSTDTAKK